VCAKPTSHDAGLAPSGLLLLLIAALLFSIGCVFIFNVSSAEALDSSSSSLNKAIIKHLVFAASGVLLGFAAWQLGVSNFLRHIDLIYIGLCLVLACCFVPGISLVANGSHRWIGFAGYYVQPSEFAKFIFPLFALKKFYDLQTSYGSGLQWKHVLPVYLWLGVGLGLILVEPDNRSTILSGSGIVVACFLAKLPARFWLIPMLVFASVCTSVALQLPYVQRRLEIFMNPEADTSGKGYQPYQAKIAAGSGRLSGRGLGHGLQKFSYLPEAQNDYIAAIIGEEFGYIGIATLVTLYASLLVCGFWICTLCSTPLVQMSSGIILYIIGIQVFVNLGVVGGLLPSTGLNLPFVSQGGSSLWACTLALSLLLNAAQNAVKGTPAIRRL
jgi:cell division protein FtsW